MVLVLSVFPHTLRNNLSVYCISSIKSNKRSLNRQMEIKDLKAYEIVEEHEVGDLHSQGMVLRHKKTGAKVALLMNDDENKVFSIAFRTPPKD